MPLSLPDILVRVRSGDILVMGELPAAAGQSSFDELLRFRKDVIPLLAGRDRSERNATLAVLNEVLESKAQEGHTPIEQAEHGLIGGLYLRMAERELLRYGARRTRGKHRGANRADNTPDNDPERCSARGLMPFTINGHTIWAGTLKGAHKKFRTLDSQGLLDP